jgi:hypothetical protein
MAQVDMIPTLNEARQQIERILKHQRRQEQAKDKPRTKKKGVKRFLKLL